MQRPSQVATLLATLLIVLALVLTFQGSQRAVAQSGGGYDLTWNTIDGGGITFATGGNYVLGGTIGQADAGALTGGSYTLSGGFWSGTGTGGALYLPLIAR